LACQSVFLYDPIVIFTYIQAVVTTTMAVGAAYLARKKAIVQKLSAIESLAGVEILCSDKYAPSLEHVN
jgi:magnesium-transporting ATPase (P-type)